MLPDRGGKGKTDGGEGGIVEMMFGEGDYCWTIETDRWVREGRLKVAEGGKGRQHTRETRNNQHMPPEQLLDKGLRTIYTKTNETTNPRITCLLMYAFPWGKFLKA